MPESVDGYVLTMLAIREYLMNYFKESCIESVVSSTNVRLHDAPVNHQYQYQRELRNINNPSFLKIDNVPIALLSKTPDVITLHEHVLERSRALRRVREGILSVMKDYLKGVKVVWDNPKDLEVYAAKRAEGDILRHTTLRNGQQDYTVNFDYADLSRTAYEQITGTNTVQWDIRP